jgi:transcriptional regulator with XRE-family HTH domain
LAACRSVAAPTPSPHALGAAVRAQRQAKQMTLETLADAAGMNVTYVSDIERGRSNPTIGKLGDLAAVFEIRVSALIAQAEDLSER